MDQESLVTEQVDAGHDLILRFDKSWTVKVAFWLKASEEGSWSLYIASEKIDDNNFDLGYGEVLRIAMEMRSPYLDPFQVKVISADHPLAIAVMDVWRRYPGRTAIRFNDRSLGGEAIAGAYLYSLPVGVSGP